MKTNKNIKHIWRAAVQGFAVLLMLWTVQACTDEDIASPNHGVVDENGMVHLSFDANIPGLKLTKSVDINGESISTLWLVAFNENGNMISRVLATTNDNVSGIEGGSGTFNAEVPSSTRRLHFLANVNMDNFSDQDNIGRHENEVIAPMVSSSGNLVYWGLKTFDSEDALTNFAANSASDPVILYRNQALVQYAVNPTSGVELEVLGWAALNQYAYGTVAPFDASAIDSDPFHFNLLDGHDFVTTLPEAYNVKQTDVESVGQASAQEGDPRYLFETLNPEDDQVYLIMQIRKTEGSESTTKYYKIMLVDENKNPYEIIRNHKYVVNITNVNESYGVDSFEAAKDATPANNPWITISDEIPEVVNGNTTLRIEGETTVIYQEAGNYEIQFYYDGTQQPAVEFTSNEGVGSISSVEWNSSTHVGTIHLNITAPASNEITTGIIQVKERDGVLSRRIKVLTSEPFEFTPVWVGSEIPLLDGENIAILFNIPDNFPQELLPIDVKFACDLIDAQTDEELKVITEETAYRVPQWTEGGWVMQEVTKDWNYKYVYSADHVGQHRVDFRTILTNISSIDHQSEFHIYMEGDDSRNGQNLFEQRDLFFAFQPNSANNNRNRRRILLEGGDAATKYTTQTINDLNPVYGEEIRIPFHLAALSNDGGNNPGWNLQTPNKNGSPTSVSATNPVEVWVYYDKTLMQPGDWATQRGQVDRYGNTYAVYEATSQSNVVTFTTISPNFDCYIVLSAKSTSYNAFDNTMGVNEEGWGFRSASVTVRSTGRLDFNPAFSTNNSSFTSVGDGDSYSIPYGEGQDVYLRINVPLAAQDKAFQFHINTAYLTPMPETGHESQWSQNGDEWVYTFQANETNGTQTFHFQTNRMVSGETITLASGSYVGFNPVTVTVKNDDLSGTIRLPEGVTFQIKNPYIILERKRDGTRIGTFAVQGSPQNQGEASYQLALRGEYNLDAADEVTVKWSPVSGDNAGKTYSYSCRLQDLMASGEVVLPLVESAQ